MKIFTKFGLIIFLFSHINFGQTTVFSDDFSTNTSTNWTTSGVIGSSVWSVTRSGDDWGARRNTSPQQLELTNDVSATANVNGWVFANVSTSSFSSPYNTALNLNNRIITWQFNMRQIRTDPAGFTGSSYGVAFILAGSSQNVDFEGNGYAVVLGQAGSTDPVRLARYTEGLSGSLTNIIISNIAGLTDFGTEYLSIRVTYNPSSDQWELFLRNDESSFADPSTGSLTSQGTATDNYYVGTPLLYSGGYWHGSTAANQTVFFDNVSVIVGVNLTEPIISLSNAFLSGFNYAEGTGPSAEQSFIISGRNLTDDILITPPVDYEISTTSGGTFTSSISLTQSDGVVISTTIYVRLKAGLSVGSYNNEAINSSSSGATTKNVICSGFVSASILPSLPLVEEFNYSSGTSLTSNGWTAHSAENINPISVHSSGLTYTDYISSGIGNSASIAENGEDVNRGFAEVNSNGSSIYYSFLVRVTETENSITGDYFIHLGDRINPTFFTNFSARVFARVDESGNVNFGLSNTSTPQWITTNYAKNTTYLIIVKYTINAAGNDEVKMWVKSSGVPQDESSAGTADVTISNQDGQNTIDAIGIRQTVNILDLLLDGIRIATSWSNAPLPVELSSFTASVVGNSIEINWRTETEVNNYGFEIERTSPRPSPYEGEGGEAGRGWEKIGFVNGNGNSNSPKSYSFTDTDVLSGKYSYRLKQIDNDGQFEYSKAIEVAIGLPDKFELSQNYPNPFNPTTKIRYSIPRSTEYYSVLQDVRLKIYDILSNEVATLVNEQKEPGYYEVEFSASELASGVYLYRLQAGSFISTKKMIVVK